MTAMPVLDRSAFPRQERSVWRRGSDVEDASMFCGAKYDRFSATAAASADGVRLGGGDQALNSVDMASSGEDMVRVFGLSSCLPFFSGVP